MTAHETLVFKNVSVLVLQKSDGTSFLFCDTDISNTSINQKYGLNMGNILTLEETYLISALCVDNEIEISNKELDEF